MRKLFVAAVVLTLTLLLSSPCFAGNTSKDSDIKIYVDGELVVTDNVPVIENDRTLVPIRAAAEKAGITVDWIGADQTVVLNCGEKCVMLTIGSNVMYVYDWETNTQRYEALDATPKIINSSTYVTLRASLEALGAGVEWSAEERSIYVTSPSKMSKKEADGADGENGENAEETEADLPLRYTGFRNMENDEITEHAPHGLYGRIISDKAITLVRCRIVGTDMDAQLRFNAADNITNYNVFTYFDKLICFSDAGLGEQTLEIYAATDGGEPQLVFSYDYTVLGKEADNAESTGDDQTAETEKPVQISSDFTYSGFREMKNHCITEHAAHGLYGRIYSEKPITYVRCRIVGTEFDEFLRFNAQDNIKNYNVFTYFDKRICFSDAGLGPQTFEIYAATDGGEPQLVFVYDYTVLGEGQSAPEVESGEPVLSFYGFRKMSGDTIKEGAPHGLYGTVVSSVPLTSVRCRIAGTDMDHTLKLDAKDGIKSYSIFKYFDKLIRFSDAGLGEQTLEIYATGSGGTEQLLFEYKYTVKSSTATEDDEAEKKPADKTDTAVGEQNVCLPLEGEIRLTSPYGFRAYNKWEFHKGIDIVSVSGSLNILAVADGIVVDCATGRNSGAGNYVAIQHEGGWVSLYYHLKSYDVEIGDRVKMGEKFAIMGKTGGNYGVHLHFMTCDNWYGGIWATQNSHHTAPHQYVPQILTDVRYYTPNYESQNKDKIILCQFTFPNVLTEGEAFSISKSKGFLAFEGKSVKKITVTVKNSSGETELEATQSSPTYYSDGYYNYSRISAKLDKLCEFDKLSCGSKTLTITVTTAAGRTRVVYTKEFEVIPKAEEEAEAETETEQTGESKEDNTETGTDDETENAGSGTEIDESQTSAGTESADGSSSGDNPTDEKAQDSTDGAVTEQNTDGHTDTEADIGSTGSLSEGAPDEVG